MSKAFPFIELRCEEMLPDTPNLNIWIFSYIPDNQELLPISPILQVGSLLKVRISVPLNPFGRPQLWGI